MYIKDIDNTVAGTISGWGLTGMLMGVYFIASIVASARRGIT